MADTKQQAADKYAAFRHPAFAAYFVALFCSAFAMQIIGVAVGWQIYDLTRDPFDLGIIGLMIFLPSLLFILLTGSAADRVSRRSIMAICEIISAISAMVLLILTWQGLTSPLPVFGILFVFGTARAFFAPASQALAPNLVPAEVLPNAVTWKSTSWQTATIVGPVAGGLLYGIGPTVPYGTATVLFIIAIVAVIVVPRQPRMGTQQAQNWQMLSAGFRYIFRQKVVLGAISLDMFAVLLGGTYALMPVFARDVLELGPWGLGLLRAGPGIGAIIMAFWLSAHPIESAAGTKMFIAVAIFGAVTVVFGLSTITWLSIVALVIMGAADMVSVYVRQTLIQLWTPDHLRGRVNAVNMLFIGSSNELGEFRAGSMAALIGTVPAVVFGGLGTLAVTALWSWGFPQLRGIGRLTDIPEDVATLENKSADSA